MAETEATKHRTALIVGASSEIGTAVTQKLAEQGYQRFILTGHRRMARLDPLSETLQGLGLDVKTVPLDLSETDAIERFLRSFKSDASLDALVYAAGCGGQRREFLSIDPSEAREIYQVNVLAALQIIQGAMPMLLRAGGSAVLVGSQAGVSGGRRLSAYASSKAALHLMGVTIARECAGDGVRVNVVAPGAIETDAMKNANGVIDEAALHDLGTTIPIGRTGKPEDVAETVSWLLSDAASYITGAVVPVTGGA